MHAVMISLEDTLDEPPSQGLGLSIETDGHEAGMLDHRTVAALMMQNETRAGLE
jgi:hypothetical protein